MAKVLKGSLQVESTLDVGSCFKLTTPFSPAEAKQGPEKREEKRAEFNGSINKALIVEDNEINRMVLAKILEKINIQFDTAVNGAEAVDLVLKNTYDLILMDLSMPVLNGIDATLKIRSFDTKTPIFCISANVIEEDQNSAIKAGMNDFLPKPLRVDMLIKMLNKYFS